MSEEKKNEAVEAEANTETKEEATQEAETAKEETKEEATEAPAADDAASNEEEVEVPEEFKALIEQVENMSVLELNKLVKVLEKKFGVSAQAVAVAGPATGGEEAEEKDEFDIELKSDGGSKIPVMKVVKSLLGLGLKEAKELVEGAPAVIKEGVKKEEAEDIKSQIEEAGGEVELK